MSSNGRLLPNVDISPQGLRELEAWLRRPVKPDAPDQWYYVHPLDPALTPADYLIRGPHPDFEGTWTNATSSDFATAFGVSRIGRQKKLWLKLAVTGDEGATNSTIFTLPATFRPAKTHRMIVREGPRGAATIDVNPDGTVVYVARVVKSGSTSPTGDFLQWGTNTDADSLGLTLSADGNVFLETNNNFLDFSAGTAASTFVAGAFDMDLTGDYRLGVDGNITLGDGCALISNELATGGTFDVRINGILVFQIDAAGDLHLKSGAAINYDL